MRACCKIKEKHSVCGQVAVPDAKQGGNNNKTEKKQEKGQGGGIVKEVITEEAQDYEVKLLILFLC